MDISRYDNLLANQRPIGGHFTAVSPCLAMYLGISHNTESVGHTDGDDG